MGRTALLQEIRKLRFEQTYEGWHVDASLELTTSAG